MSLRTRIVGLLLVGGTTFLGGLVGWLLNRFSDDRIFYKPILGVYNTGFFVEYEQARRLGDEWISNDREVADRYIHEVDYCPFRTVRNVASGPSLTVWIIEDECVSGMFTVKNRRVELTQTDGVWIVTWAGIKYKCARDPNDLGNQLIIRNPLRLSRWPVAKSVTNQLYGAAITLNSWHTQCP